MTVTEEEADKMTKEEKKDYCLYCWGSDYGPCSKCALEPKQKETSKPEVFS